MKIVTDVNKLREKCTKLNMLDMANVTKNFKTYVNIMINNDGCGLAAPQIGIHKRFFIATVYGNVKLFINPEIIEYSKETNEDFEGCLSVPNLLGKIARHDWIKIKYFSFKEHKIVTEVYKGFSARVIQHEYDHLNGKVCILDCATEVIEKDKVEQGL